MGVDCLGREAVGRKDSNMSSSSDDPRMRLSSESSNDDGLENLEPLELDDLRRYVALSKR
jgi:hypothetical protein